MGKRVILYLFLLFSLSLQAQTEEKVSLGNDSTEVDSTATAKPSAFKRAIKKFMNFSDFDTLYISPNRYNYALMVTHFSNFEYYSITSELPQPQKLSFSPNPHNKIGLYFGWRWIFLGWSVDVNDIFKKGTRKNRGTEFDLSLYSSKLGVDIFYRRTGNNYKIHKIRGFSDDIPSNYSEDFSGIKVMPIIGSLPATAWRVCLSLLPLPTKLPMWTQKRMRQKRGTVNSIWIFCFAQGLSTTPGNIT